MFIEGRGLTSSVALEGGIKRVSVNLHNAGIGIKTGDFPFPKLWFGHANGYARFDREAGVLEVVQRQHMASGRLPQFWLDLPRDYQKKEKPFDEIDIMARGDVEVNGLHARELTVNTWGDVALTGVHIGSSCLAKTIHGDLRAHNVTPPEGTDPGHYPSIDLIAITGIVTVTDSVGLWRLSGREVCDEGAVGPRHISYLRPLREPQPV